MQFVHTADWQIGMKAAGAGAAGARVRAARLDAAERVVALEGDFLLAAGDTFEDNAVDGALVQRTGEILAKFRGPVYLLPGNHDPLQPGSVWDHPVWKQFGNLHVIREAGAVAVPGGTLLAAPLRETHSKRDPSAALAELARPEGVVIGMSHGTVEGIDPDTEHHPVARESWRRAKVDYLALGHWHSRTEYADESGTVRMAYCGTHETTKFGERDSGNVLRVRIEGGRVTVEPVRTGTLDWVTIDEAVQAPGDVAAVRDRVAKLADGALVRVAVRGLLHADEAEMVRQLEEMGERFTVYSLDTSGLRPAAEEGWEDGLPAGALRQAARRLRQEASEGSEAAAEALLELQALAAEAGA